MMKLPKLYALVNITFWSLKTTLSPNYGACFDTDTKVTRKCRRVLLKDRNWKWQLVDYDRNVKNDWQLEQDKEILDEYGSNLKIEYIKSMDAAMAGIDFLTISINP